MYKRFLRIKSQSSMNLQKGMTLIELLVVLAIFMIVAGLTIFDYGSFRSTISTQNLANDIALSVRKAQSYAIGVHSSTVSGDGLATTQSFRYGYGIHFTTDTTTINPLAGNNKSFILFTDIAATDSDQGYNMYNYPVVGVLRAQMGGGGGGSQCGDLTPGNECSEILSITSADAITGIYLNDDAQPQSDPTGSIDIVFHRPNPDAYFCYKIANRDTDCARSSDISSVTIEVSNQVSSSPIIKKIKISNTGQISVL